AVYISYGGLLMRLEGELRHLSFVCLLFRDMNNKLGRRVASTNPSNAHIDLKNAKSVMKSKVNCQAKSTKTQKFKAKSNLEVSNTKPSRFNSLTLKPKTTLAREVIAKYKRLLCKTSGKDEDTIMEILKLLFTYGIPSSYQSDKNSLRSAVWRQILTRNIKISADYYITLCESNIPELYHKIDNDACRTMPETLRRCGRSTEMVARVLNAFTIHAKNTLEKYTDLQLKFGYIQGMNVILAPFLCIMPELDAFYCFSTFIQHIAPMYFQPHIEGSICGIQIGEWEIFNPSNNISLPKRSDIIFLREY
ncbi:RabGAP/TBC, partial [Rozella allomycis CSF55]